MLRDVNGDASLLMSKDNKLIHMVGDCIFLINADELSASFMEVFNFIH